MMVRRQLSQEGKERVIEKLRRLLAQREEVQFACIHGSFLEPQMGFRDIDIGVWVEPSLVGREISLEYEWELDSWLERHVPHPVDVKVLNYAPLGFRYAASGGLLLFAQDEVAWYDFRERTWEEYLDFAPLARQMLFDLLDAQA